MCNTPVIADVQDETRVSVSQIVREEKAAIRLQLEPDFPVIFSADFSA